MLAHRNASLQSTTRFCDMWYYPRGPGASLQMTTDLRDMFLTMGVATGGRGGGGGGYSNLPLLKSGGDVPTRFENEVAKGHI